VSPAAIGLGELPQDGVQPWEELDARGYVVRPSRRSAAIGTDSQFVPGVERFSEVGQVSDDDDVAVVVAGSKSISGGIYRLPMGGAQPSTIVIDANLHVVAGKKSEYWVGVSDYGKGRWELHGPFSDAQVTFTLDKAANHISPLGNIFIAVNAYDNTQLDIVGITVSSRDDTDVTAPPVPAAPTAAAVDGGLELAWADVIAGDLAGYRVYWSYSPFSAPTDNGVNALPYLENTTQMVLPVAQKRTVYFALSAVDSNGNESALSIVQSKLPVQVLTSLGIGVSATGVSVQRGAPVSITASGAELYDFDTDGDGDFDITGNATGTASVDTSATGIIRPRVRAHSSDGKAVAFGSVSLIVSGNQRPVASGHADPAFGHAPLAVHFTGIGEDFDGAIAEYAWDIDGDGFYDEIDAASADVDYTYNLPGLTNAKLRVTDDQGAWDVDTVGVQVNESSATLTALPAYAAPSQKIVLQALSDNPAMLYEWDLDGNGTFERNTVTQPTTDTSFASPGEYTVRARLTFTNNYIVTIGTSILVSGFRLQTNLDAANPGSGNLSLALINGVPAIAFRRTAPAPALMYMRALDGLGTSWAAPVVADPDFLQGHRPDLEEVGGRPAIVSGNANNGNVVYVRALDADGTTWPLVTQVATSPTLPNPSMEVIAGNPAVAFTGPGVDMYYSRALDAEGQTWGVPTLISSNGSTGFDCSLAVVNGKPAVSYYNSGTSTLFYSHAQDSFGASWVPEIPVSGGVADSPTALGFYAGKPVIAYQINNPFSGLYFARAGDAAGDSWSGATWVDGTSSAAAGSWLSMAIIGDRPQVLYYQQAPGQFVLRSSIDTGGVQWGAARSLCMASIPGPRSSVLDLGGRAACCFYDSSGSTGLCFGIYY
jgi:hypothetical protein